jgi:hypothetical protein
MVSSSRCSRDCDSISSKARDHTVHFQDVRRWANAFNVSERINKIRTVVNSVKENELLSLAELETLMSFPVDGPLPGFPDSLDPPSLTSLHELLYENWLGERVIDAYLHIIGQQLDESYPGLIQLYDCYFHLELTSAFEKKKLTPQLRQLRDNILAKPPRIVAFFVNKDQVHWAPTATVLDDRLVLQGDSAGFQNNPRLRSMMEWLLSDIAPEDGPWSNGILATERQGPGSGSCAIASASSIVDFAVESAKQFGFSQPSIPISSVIPRWTNATSATVRFQWLRTLLLFAIDGSRFASLQKVCEVFALIELVY